MKNKIYLDYNSSTPVDKRVIVKINNCLKYVYGNPASIHLTGQRAKKVLENARENVAKLISANSDEIIFTSGGTESINLAIKGIFFQHQKQRNHIITSAIEHHSVLKTVKFLKDNFNAEVSIIPVDKYGVVNLQSFKNALQNNTLLVSIMSVNNETGVIQPISQISNIISEFNNNKSVDNKIFFHTDAIQGVGKLNINVKELNVDLLSLSGHKIYATKGIGVLFLKNQTKIIPQIHGGHQESEHRAGTENIPSIAGLGTACLILKREMEANNKKIFKLKKMLWNGIKTKFKKAFLNGKLDNTVSNTLNVSFDNIIAENLMLNLDFMGIAVSTGAACTLGAINPSHVLTAMGLNEKLAKSSIRFSLGKYNTKKEIEYVIDTVSKLVKHL